MKLKRIFLVMEGWSTPAAFTTSAAAHRYLKQMGYVHKQKNAPYYWQSQEEANDPMHDSEFRAWLITSPVLG